MLVSAPPLKVSEAFSHCFSLKTLKVAFSSVSVEFLWSLEENIHRFPHLKEFRGMVGCDFNDAHIPPLLALKIKRPEIVLDCFRSLTKNGLKQVVKTFSDIGYNQRLYADHEYDFIKSYNKEFDQRKSFSELPPNLKRVFQLDSELGF